MSLMGKVVRVGLNAITPGYSKACANATNTGLKKIINGTLKQQGDSLIFQSGLKHAIVRTCYGDSLKAYHTGSKSLSGVLQSEQFAKFKKTVPRCLQNAIRELSIFNRGNGAYKLS